MVRAELMIGGVLTLAACDSAPAHNPFVTTTPATVVRSPALVFDGEPPHHVLMMSIDTTRRDRFGPYSATGIDYTPFLSSLAAAGFAASDLLQCSNWTYASTSCTLNGRYAEENGFVPTLHHKITAPENQLPPDQRTLADRLTEEGYTTILVSANDWLSPQDNNAQGYQEFSHPAEGNAGSVVADGLARLDVALEAGETDWFLHLHLVEPHPPYNPPLAYLEEEAALPPLDPSIDLTTSTGHYTATDHWPDLDPAAQANLEAHLWARYHGELRYLDDQLADAWPEIEQAGLLEDTLVVVWTDHGEQFWEHRDQSHAWSLHAEENDGVLFFWSETLRPGEWTETAHAVDISPTVLAALDLPASDPWFSGEVLGLAPVHRPLYASANARKGMQAAVTLDGWKLVYDFGGKLRLYDRSTDRTETVDRMLENPDDPHLAPLWDLLLPRIHALQPLVPNQSPTWPDGLPH